MPESCDAEGQTGWFDRAQRFSCDSVFPHLLTNSLLALYGYPYFVNAGSSLRHSYTAKQTTMFTDTFVFDQCRYFFDWFPVVELVPARFKSRGFQVVARCIMDRIGRSDWSSDSHPFRLSAVIPIGSGDLDKPREFPERVEVR